LSRHFTTDQQTLDDLNIFGRRGGASIHALFDRTATTKGSRLLEELLRHPLCDPEEINRRSSIIRHFAAAGTAFPFNNELFDIAEQYLANTDERSRLSGREQGLGQRLSSMIAEDNEYKTMYKGITALLQLLQSTKRLVSAYAAGTAWESERKAMALLLSGEDLQQLLQEGTKAKIPFNRLVQYDNLLRFRHRDPIGRLLRHIYYLDVCISVARVAVDRQFVFPLALPQAPLSLHLEDVRHPGIASAVANSISITAEDNVIFLTGANMAGKSTLMKTLGIALFLAHVGFPVPAASMEFSVMDGIFTTINLPDDLGMGASHFYAEVLRVKKIAKALSQGRKLLVIFDELFRGTNVKDAYEATVAVTRAFAKKRDSAFVISTHIVEAGEALRSQCRNIRYAYLPTQMNGTQPIYTYRLLEGITADRHGMIIIQNEGILEMLQHGNPKTTSI
jgi:DNA mismatch repair protein MutS